jgi:DNA-binding transcriptional ArsR family regulator
MSAAPALDLVHDVERAATILHPVRLRLLEELTEPDSAAGLARRLKIPRQKVNYYLRQLEDDGFVELVEERRKGNCTERVLRATARSYLIAPSALGRLAADPAQVRDQLSATYLVAVAARAIEELATVRRQADSAKKRVATLSIQTDVRFASAADQHAFAEELATQVAALVAKYHDERSRGGHRFRLFMGAYPAPAEPATTPHPTTPQEG